MQEHSQGALALTLAEQIREALISGGFSPGEKLSEQAVALQYGVSRNTLREAFRLLGSQRLLDYQPNRGVFVAKPDAAAVIDIYRLRAVIQRGAVQQAHSGHPELARMRELVLQGEALGAAGDWQAVGTNNMAFHRAMVRLCDSPRLSAAFDLVLAELRLVFGQLEDGATLHEPFIKLNQTLLGRIESGYAVAMLEDYLLRSERAVLAALQRRG